jgi:hypothetical protein
VATNGTRFAHYDFVRRCENAKLQTLYLQFDGMSDEVYLALRGQPLLAQKLRVYGNIVRTSMRVVLVPTIVAGLNVDQLGPIFRFALEHSRHTTGISVQPMAATGRVNLRPPRRLQPRRLATSSAPDGLTRVPDDWIPLNALTMLTRGIARLARRDRRAPPATPTARSGPTSTSTTTTDPPADELPRPRACSSRRVPEGPRGRRLPASRRWPADQLPPA